MTSNRPTVIKEDTSEEEILSFKENRYFSPVLSGVEGLDDNIIIMIPYRQNISFRDIRIKLVKEGFDIALKEKGFSSFSFTLFRGAPTRVQPKQENDWKVWNIWEYLEGEGTGSYQNPHPIFVEGLCDDNDDSHSFQT